VGCPDRERAVDRSYVGAPLSGAAPNDAPRSGPDDLDLGLEIAHKEPQVSQVAPAVTLILPTEVHAIFIRCNHVIQYDRLACAIPWAAWVLAHVLVCVRSVMTGYCPVYQSKSVLRSGEVPAYWGRTSQYSFECHPEPEMMSDLQQSTEKTVMSSTPCHCSSHGLCILACQILQEVSIDYSLFICREMNRIVSHQTRLVPEGDRRQGKVYG
jgi:hypothetical protein